MKRAVFLDRDGVLNNSIVKDGKPYPPRTLEEFKLIDGMKEGLLELKKKGFLLIVVTNQPDVGRGTQKKEIVEQFHEKLRREFPIDDIYVCFDDADVVNKKPAPGMLLTAAKKWDIDLKSSYMVGDRWKDVEAGHRAGCKTVFIHYGYEEKNPDNADQTVSSPIEATEFISIKF